jgi:hypothetical protein
MWKRFTLRPLYDMKAFANLYLEDYPRGRHSPFDPIVLDHFKSACFQNHELRARAFPTRG